MTNGAIVLANSFSIHKGSGWLLPASLECAGWAPECHQLKQARMKVNRGIWLSRCGLQCQQWTLSHQSLSYRRNYGIHQPKWGRLPACVPRPSTLSMVCHSWWGSERWLLTVCSQNSECLMLQVFYLLLNPLKPVLVAGLGALETALKASSHLSRRHWTTDPMVFNGWSSLWRRTNLSRMLAMTLS